MAARDDTAPPQGRRRKPVERRPGAAGPDLTPIMARLGAAAALVAVALRSLEAREIPGTGQESLVLEAAVAALDAVYEDLDRADSAIRAARP